MQLQHASFRLLFFCCASVALGHSGTLSAQSDLSPSAQRDGGIDAAAPVEMGPESDADLESTPLNSDTSAPLQDAGFPMVEPVTSADAGVENPPSGTAAQVLDDKTNDAVVDDASLEAAPPISGDEKSTAATNDHARESSTSAPAAEQESSVEEVALEAPVTSDEAETQNAPPKATARPDGWVREKKGPGLLQFRLGNFSARAPIFLHGLGAGYSPVPVSLNGKQSPEAMRLDTLVRFGLVLTADDLVMKGLKVVATYEQDLHLDWNVLELSEATALAGEGLPNETHFDLLDI